MNTALAFLTPTEWEERRCTPEFTLVNVAPHLGKRQMFRRSRTARPFLMRGQQFALIKGQPGYGLPLWDLLLVVAFDGQERLLALTGVASDQAPVAGGRVRLRGFRFDAEAATFAAFTVSPCRPSRGKKAAA